MRHEKFSSIGRDLTEEINQGKIYKTNRKITSVGVHCSFSPQGRGDDVHTIDRWHLENGWAGIGYHYVVLEDGTILKGRWVDYPGGHVKDHNSDTIGICRMGGMNSEGYAVYDATPKQIEAIQKLTRLLISLKMYKLSTNDILGHNEYPDVSKLCPLMDMDEIRKFS